jgi:hypothetical protein
VPDSLRDDLIADLLARHGEDVTRDFVTSFGAPADRRALNRLVLQDFIRTQLGQSGNAARPDIRESLMRRGVGSRRTAERLIASTLRQNHGRFDAPGRDDAACHHMGDCNE